MDVTQEYLEKVQLYGGSDYTNPSNLAASRTLNYAEGPTMQRAVKQTCSTIPFKFDYSGAVGLFGAENIFFKITLDISETSPYNCFEEQFWECLYINLTPPDDLDPNYGTFAGSPQDPAPNTAIIDFDAADENPVPSNGYVPAFLSSELPFQNGNELIGVKLYNLGTGNQYVDKDLDVRLYSSCRFEHGFDEMLTPLQSTFYVGIHARNTKRIDYNVRCLVGSTYRDFNDLNSEEKQLLPFCP